MDKYEDPFEILARKQKEGREKPQGDGAVRRLGVWNAGTDDKLPDPRPWLLGNSFCRGYVSSIVGAGGGGKTALRHLQAISLAAYRELTGEHVFQRTRVLLVSLEDDDKELRRRIWAARLHYKIPLSELDGWLFLSAPGGGVGKLLTLNPRNGGLILGELGASIEAEIRAHDIGLIVLDPLIKTHAVNENDNAAMDAVAQILTDIATKHNVAVDVAHHVSKGPGAPGNADRGRGASASRDAGRLVFTHTTMSPEEAQAFNIPEDDRRDYFRVDRGKLNIARTAGPAVWFKLIGVPLGNATDLYPAGDSVQTVELWSPPATWAGLDSELQNRILTAIDAGSGDGNFYTASNATTDRAAWRVVQSFAPNKSESQCREVITTWLKTGQLERFEYTNPKTRKEVVGLKANATKRPV